MNHTANLFDLTLGYLFSRLLTNSYIKHTINFEFDKGTQLCIKVQIMYSFDLFTSYYGNESFWKNLNSTYVTGWDLNDISPFFLEYHKKL